MNQNIQKVIRAALVILPLAQTVIAMAVRDGTKVMDAILFFGLLTLGCAVAFCICFGKRMFERLLISAGLGALITVCSLFSAVIPVNWQTILATVLFSVEFILSVLYAIGRKYWLFL